MEEMFNTGWRQYVPGLDGNVFKHMFYHKYHGTYAQNLIYSIFLAYHQKLFIKHPPAYEIIADSKSLANVKCMF